MTSTDGESGHALPDVPSVEVEFSNDNWDPGSYLDAVREDLASAFAPAPSLPPAVQRTNPIAKPLRIQETPRTTPGRTGRPIILRDLRKHTSSLLTQETTSRLLRSLTQRDLSTSRRPPTTPSRTPFRSSNSSLTASARLKCGCSCSPITA